MRSLLPVRMLLVGLLGCLCSCSNPGAHFIGVKQGWSRTSPITLVRIGDVDWRWDAKMDSWYCPLEDRITEGVSYWYPIRQEDAQLVAEYRRENPGTFVFPDPSSKGKHNDTEN